MTVPQAAADHYRVQQAITVATARETDRLWSQMGDEFDASWAQIRGAVVNTVGAGQLEAAANGADYVPDVLDETGVDAPPVAVVRAEGFVGATRDGRQLDTLLDQVVVRTKGAVASGLSVAGALAQGGRWLQGVTMDSVREADRQAVAAGITARPAVTGWVRMLNPPSCKFCITLAGKWYRWNTGFQSHPHCDCRHIPAQEAAAGDFTVDPYAYFHSLDAKTQDRLFGKNDAQAIRDGGDIYRVVNVRARGLSNSKAGVRFGTPSRMTVDDIYRAAGSREESITLLTREGYVTGDQVAGGNILGNRNTDAEILARGRGRGAYVVGGQSVTTARAARYDAIATGQRDPMNRATMTDGERRIYDDFVRAEQALIGRRPRTIGANSADRGQLYTPISEREAEQLRMAFIRRIDRVRRNGTAQERVIAERLWARYNALL